MDIIMVEMTIMDFIIIIIIMIDIVEVEIAVAEDVAEISN
jgi:hypothetical protein